MIGESLLSLQSLLQWL